MTQSTDSATALQTLEAFREGFKSRRFLATPLAGAIVWTLIGISGALFSTFVSVWVLFIGTGSIVYLGMLISRFTGENFFAVSKEGNPFDGLFFLSTLMAFLVYSIAIPFFLVETTSLPLSVGILTGLMWIPFGWAVEHWVGLFHTLSRTAGIVLLYFLFPELRFVVIPAYIVLIYAITLVVLHQRWQAFHRG